MSTLVEHPPVRLEPWEITVIRESFQKTFLPEDHLWLFGSRADLTKRGGDIDLYIETKMTKFEDWRKAENQFHLALIDGLGDQQIDIVVYSGGEKQFIHRMAIEHGVKLL